ncbi:MAG: discoidin domain-containing protein [Chloroflexi bacterium]|nr:discoidin domain-containing protein [Chloroflexota bacterium]
MTGETERPPATRPPRKGLYRPRRYATGRSIEQEPVTLDRERPPGSSAPLASFMLILAWLVVWSIDARSPIPAFAGFVLAFVVVVIFPQERIAFEHLGRRLILLPAALALPITYVVLRLRGVDSILDAPAVLILVLLLTPLALVVVHTRERGTAPIPLLTLVLMLGLPVAVIGYGFVEQRFVGAEHEPLIIEEPSVNKVFGIGSIGGRIESVTSEAEGHPASLLIDSVVDGTTPAWRSADSGLPQDITIQLNPPRALERIVFYNASEEPLDTWPRQVEIAIDRGSGTLEWVRQQPLRPDIENVVDMPSDVVTALAVRIAETFGAGGYVSLAEVLPIGQ